MTSPRSHFTSTLLQDGKVLAAGGAFTYPFVQTNTADLYDPGTGVWTRTGSLNEPRFYHTATLLNNGWSWSPGKQYPGGFGECGTLQPRHRTWTSTGPMAAARSLHTATLFLDGTVLVAGGFASSGSVTNAETYNPATGTWTAAGFLSKKRRNHTAVRLTTAGPDCRRHQQRSLADAKFTTRQLNRGAPQPDDHEPRLAGLSPFPQWQGDGCRGHFR